MKNTLLLLTLSLMVACASPLPKGIQEAPKPSLSLAEARSGPTPIGARVRWGGTIASVENKKTETWLEIVERPLQDEGRPLSNGASAGRFIARAQGFLDPDEYAPGRTLTVAGTLTENIARSIGEHPYTFAVVQASEHYLWPRVQRRQAAPAYYDPFWDPFWPHPFLYDPWYPFGPYRYHHHHY